MAESSGDTKSTQSPRWSSASSKTSRPAPKKPSVAVGISTTPSKDFSLEPDPVLQNFVNGKDPKQLDPRLQGLLLQGTNDVETLQKVLKSSVTSASEFAEAYRPKPNLNESMDPWVDVLARLGDPEKPVPNLHVFRKIGAIVTGRVPLGHILDVRNDPNVVSLKAATELRLQLKYSVPASHCTAAEFQQLVPPNGVDGADVIIGIVDRGCDFAHRNFRDDSGYTRLLYLWDQRPTDDPHPPRGFEYGREFESARIGGAILQPDNPYAALGYPLDAASHGTHVMDVAAGNGNGTGRPGVAPRADLIFVDLATGDADDTPPQGGSPTKSSQRFGTEEHLGNSRYLLEAVDYIFSKAEQLGRPCVVNLSLGTYGGPHDGTTLVEMAFETLLEKPGRAIVIAAGNAGQQGIHASGTVTKDRSKILVWQFEETAEGEEECEIWYDDPGKGLQVTLVTPDGQPVSISTKKAASPAVGPGETYRLVKPAGEAVGYVIHRQGDPNHVAPVNQVNLRVPASPGKAWMIKLETVGEDIGFDAWIDDGRHSSFEEYYWTGTLGALCGGVRTIVVGAYDARTANAAALADSSVGPTRDNKKKPEVSAPGAGVCAAYGRSHSALIELSGTSMAAPHVSGVVALLFQLKGKAKVDEIRAALINQADWREDLGYGRLDGVAAIRTLGQKSLPPAMQTLPSLAPATLNGHGYSSKNGNANGNSNGKYDQPVVIQLIDPQGNFWQGELKPQPR